MKNVKFLLFVVVVTLVLLEITLRLVSTTNGHIVNLFNKPAYYLAPFEMPVSFPTIKEGKGLYNVYDRELGWSIGKSGSDGSLYFSDAQGYRCSENTFRNPTDTLLKNDFDIVCLGDSFTHGDEVKFEETWPYYLEQETGLKVLNLGVGGYGIDQAGLRYTKEKPNAKLVILGLIAGDLERAQTQLYSVYTGGLKTKPKFQFNGESIAIVNQPAIHGDELKSAFEKPETSLFLKSETYFPALFVRSWSDQLYTARIIKTFPIWKNSRQATYVTDDERLMYCIKILLHFKKEVEKNGSSFRVLILDNLNTFTDWKKGDPWNLVYTKLNLYGIEYLTYGDAFYQDFKVNPDTIINKGLVHYTPYANKKVAFFLKETEAIQSLVSDSNQRFEIEKGLQ